jgi:anaerobic magnesium-protoporphyrin IX monomethyl ester cyclase
MHMRRSEPPFDIVIAYPAETFRIFDTMIPLGIGSIIAVLQKSGYTVRFVDFNHYRGDFASDLRKWSPRLVGIGGTTPTRLESFKIARLVKRTIPEIPTVYGGVHATFTAGDTLRHVPEIDYILKGEGEFSFAELSRKFVRGEDIRLSGVSGLCRRDDGRVLENPAARIDDLDTLPVPVREMEDIGYSFKMDFCGLEGDFIMTSRGCPARCTFCSASAMFPGGFRFRSMDKVRDELEMLLAAERPFRGLKIFDSTFTANREHVLRFCDMIRRYGIQWECEVRADTVDFPLLKEMKEAGCYYVDIGLETSNPRLLRSLNKNITLRQVDDTLDGCKTLGIKTKLFMIFGLLDETPDDCRRDVRYLKERKDRVDHFAATFGLRVYPGTAIERQLIRRKVMPDDFSWATYRPSRSNWLLLEFGNSYILRQPRLSFFRLLRVGLSLLMQRTLMSSGHIVKLLTSNACNLFSAAAGFPVRVFRALGSVLRTDGGRRDSG